VRLGFAGSWCRTLGASAGRASGERLRGGEPDSVSSPALAVAFTGLHDDRPGAPAHRSLLWGVRNMSLRYMSLAISLIAACFGASAHATTFFVASNGSDAAACSQPAPCATIANALNNALPNDTIVCVDAVSDTAFTITKSIDIECSGARAVMRDGIAGGASILINIPVSPNTDPLRTVRLRGIIINGAVQTARFVPRGIDIVSAAVVSIEDVVVSDVIQQGIIDRRTGGQTKLFVIDSIIRNNGGPGIVAAAAAVGIVALDNVRSENNGYGIAVASGNNVSISRSVFSGNSNAGVEGDAGAQVVVDNSTITHNNIGVQSGSSVRMSNNNIAFNNAAISGVSGTFGNNRFSGNGTIGTAPTPLGGASSDLGQQ
jgi:Right handed beta helix region